MSRAEARRGQLSLKTRVILKVILCLAVVGIICGAFRWGLLIGSREEPAPTVTSDLLGEQLRSVQELVTVSYYYTNMGKFENQLDFYGWQVPLTTKSFIVSYDGIIRAGVDLSAVRVTVDETARTVTVVLPPSRIFSHEIPEDSIEIFDETRNIFNPITIEDYTSFTRDQKEAIEQRALENNLLANANEQARLTVQSFLSLFPGLEDYQITVRSSTARS